MVNYNSRVAVWLGIYLEWDSRVVIYDCRDLKRLAWKWSDFELHSNPVWGITLLVSNNNGILTDTYSNSLTLS